MDLIDINPQEEIKDNSGARSTAREVIIVSGSSRLIGTALTNKLSDEYRVIGLDNVGYPFPPITAECVCIDITSDESMANAMRRIEYGYEKQVASVIHLAAYYDFAGKASPLYDQITGAIAFSSVSVTINSLRIKSRKLK
jgi:hypothetical protein